VENEMIASLKGCLRSSGKPISKLGNCLAFIHQRLGDKAWAGIYIYDSESDHLYLSLFSGTPACELIGVNQGVVGCCYQKAQTIYVPDVRNFPGYIVCDPLSKSELCIPLYVKGSLVGVFDIDSPRLNGLIKEKDALMEAAKLIAPLLG
jgi:L-methionine (R)-S-oxide reductase